MSEFLMYVISYTFVACVLFGAIFAFSMLTCAVQEFFEGFLSVFLGIPRAEEIASYVPYFTSGLLFALLWIALWY